MRVYHLRGARRATLWLALPGGLLLILAALAAANPFLWTPTLVLAGVLALLVVPPFFTPHELGESALWLRQGVTFSARIPYADMAAVELSRERPVGLGVRVGLGGLWVVTSARDLVAVHLKSPRNFRLLGVIPVPRRDRAVFNADDPQAVVAAIAARIAAARG